MAPCLSTGKRLTHGVLLRNIDNQTESNGVFMSYRNTKPSVPFRWEQYPGTGPRQPRPFWEELQNLFRALMRKAIRYQRGA